MNDERPSPEQLLEWVLDLTVYAPVGVAIAVREQLPKRVKQGRQAMENRVQLARFIGQLAVQTGQREIAKRIEQQRRLSAAPPIGPDETGGSNRSGSLDATADQARSVAAVRVPIPIGEQEPVSSPLAVDEPPRAVELPIRDYESLAAIHVVERLRSMRPDEIELIRRFERAHRSRRTILAKIDQLQAR